jgi:uncharacterized membrane protein
MINYRDGSCYVIREVWDLRENSRTGQGGTALEGSSLLLVMLFLATSLLPAICPVPTAEAAIVTDPFVDPNNLMWALPIKVTRNDLDDQNPSIKVDNEGNADIVYQQSGTDYMWARVSPPAQILTTDKRLETGYIPTQYQIKNESTPQPTEFFDVGPDGSMHIVWTEAGLLDNKYQRFDKFGEPLTGIIPMNQITDLSRLPYLGVGGNGRAYIAFENEGTAWVQMTFVDQEGLLRSPALIGRPGENVALAVGPDGNIHMFYRSLGADVRLFHVKLDPDRRPLVPVRPLFPNGSIVANAFSSMPTIAITPNGHVHLIISNTTIAPHPLYYIELDENGTPIMDFVKIADGAYNYGDIAADPDNGVFIAWDEQKDGEVHYLHVQGGVPGKEVRITETGGKARHPQICSDGERGDLHLAYVNIGSGQGEVFYRYANAVRIAMDIPEIAQARRVHPGGGDIDLNVTVTNLADVPVKVSFETKVDYQGLQGHNWSFKFPAVAHDIGPDKTTRDIAVLTAPTYGDPGEWIDISITATPDRAPNKAVTMAFRSTLVINHSISISGPSKWPLSEKSEQVPLKITNQGDVGETIDLSVRGGVPGWSLALDNSSMTLLPGALRALALNVTLPDGVAQDTVAPVTVIARSRDHPATEARLDLSLVAYPSVFPVALNGTVIVYVAPGGLVSAKPMLSNLGISDAVLDLAVHVASGIGEWNLSIPNGRITVPPGQTAPMEILVGAPTHAVAGPGLSVELEATEIHGKARESVRVEARVLEVRAMNVTGGGYTMALPGETASYPVTIKNLGNSERVVELSVAPLPAGWKWQYGDEIGLSSLALGPYSRIALRLFVTPPTEFNGPRAMTLEGTVTSDGETYRFYATISALPRYNISVDADTTVVKAALEREAVFNLTIWNHGTGELILFPCIGGLPPENLFYQFWAGGEIASSIAVPMHDKVTIKLVLKLPPRMNVNRFSFWAGATASPGGTATVNLTVEVRLPDLKVALVSFPDYNLRDGDVGTVQVLVANKGDFVANSAIVEVDGVRKTVDVPAGAEVPVNFTVTFHSDAQRLVVLVDPDNLIQEKNDDDNTVYHIVSVNGGVFVPGFEAPVLIFIILIVVLISYRSPELRSISR